MPVCRGVAVRKTVVLPPDAALAEGSIVEVHITNTATEWEEGDTADQRVQAALVVAGLLERAQSLGARAAEAAPPLLRLPDPPVSETIVAQRR
jgi:hypothetical protein